MCKYNLIDVGVVLNKIKIKRYYSRLLFFGKAGFFIISLCNINLMGQKECGDIIQNVLAKSFFCSGAFNPLMFLVG